MHAPRFVIDIQHTPADHHRHEDGQRDRSRQQILHVFDVGIKLDNLQNRLLQNARLDGRVVERAGDLSKFIFERGAHEVVAVIHHQRNFRLILLVHPPRILRWNNHRTLNLAVAHILQSLLLVVVVNRLKGTHVGAHRIECFMDPDGLRAPVLIHQPQLRVFDFSAEGIAQYQQLHQRKNHRHHHQCR